MEPVHRCQTTEEKPVPSKRDGPGVWQRRIELLITAAIIAVAVYFAKR